MADCPREKSAVEKILGFNGKNDIEKYGIEKFCAECKKNVRLNEEAFVKLTDRMGQLIDTKDPYVTCDNDFIESEWWILSEMHKKGLFRRTVLFVFTE